MAYPFGGHPTLASYIDWARTKGCSAQNGVVSDEDGRVHTLTRIKGPAGKWATLAGISHHERLVPSMVAYLDRRLGITSPFPSLGDGEDDGGEG